MRSEILELLGVANSAAIAATAAYSLGLCFVRKNLRLHALSAATAACSAVYGFLGALQFNIGPGLHFLWIERVSFGALLILGPVLVALGRTLRNRPISRVLWALPAASAALLTMTLGTELIDSSTVIPRQLWLHRTGYDLAPGPLAPVFLVYLATCGVLSGYDFIAYAFRKRTWLRTFVYAGTALYFLTGVNDCFVKMNLLDTGYVFAFGVLGCAATIATVGLVTHLEAIEEVERARTDLEAAVEARTQALREAQSHLMQEHQLAAMGRLSAGVAHEINNPLAAIHANLTFLREAFPRGATPADVDAAVRESLDACQRTSQIVKDLSSLSRKRKSNSARILLSTPVQTAVRFLARSHPLAKGVQLRIERDVFVMGDETGLGQVAVNLLENALQAIEGLPAGSGRVLVEVRRDNGSSVLSIEDNGPGVPRELRGQIFDPFFTTKDVGRGTGLGLSICATIVADHKGSIVAEDAESGGARFVVRMPAA